MKISKVLSIMLSVILFITLCGCGENEQVDSKNNETQSQVITTNNESQSVNENKDSSIDNVIYAEDHPVASSFKASSGNQIQTAIAQQLDIHDWNDFKESVQTEQEVKRLDELKDTSKKYKINGKEYNFVYDISIVYPDGEKVHKYRNGQMSVQYSVDKLTGFTISSNDAFEYKYSAETLNQREELARQAVQEFLLYDTTGFVYSETKVGSDVNGYLDYYVGDKKINKSFVTRFNEKGNLFSCVLLGGGNMTDFKKYPDFNYNECFKTAQDRFLEKAKSYKDAVKYTNLTELNGYCKIEDTYYYKFRFGIMSGITGSQHEFLEDEQLVTCSAVVDIYVELITE